VKHLLGGHSKGLVRQDKYLQLRLSGVAYADYSKDFARLVKYLWVIPSGVAYADHIRRYILSGL
jgi:hypothetical protein